MKVDDKLLDYLFQLAHLPPASPSKKKQLKGELSRILEYVTQLTEVDTKEVEILQRPYPLKNVGHKDEVVNSGLGPEILPPTKKYNNYLVVAGLIDKEGAR